MKKEIKLTETEKELILSFAGCNMSVSETGKNTHYHRNSVYYHFKRIYEKTSLNPLNFFDLVELCGVLKNNENLTNYL
jgi:sugar diacid utilization regulator